MMQKIHWLPKRPKTTIHERCAMSLTSEATSHISGASGQLEPPFDPSTLIICAVDVVPSQAV